ncbi:hypothetical protein ARMGADRAFT_362657 [Armillaria gallica]|uniref:Uncharacterized protein n=1 Tax=Armillaria gallica TaxID=47427 RepID=A0A2H3DMC1_ARMGA|nr:hypothetical protein ARMGADRAFT_362657 [Armillaria gallica]
MGWICSQRTRSQLWTHAECELSSALAVYLFSWMIVTVLFFINSASSSRLSYSLAVFRHRQEVLQNALRTITSFRITFPMHSRNNQDVDIARCFQLPEPQASHNYIACFLQFPFVFHAHTRDLLYQF